MPAPEPTAPPEPPAAAEVKLSAAWGATAAVLFIVVAAVAGLSVWYLFQAEPLVVQGEADATRIDIAARVDGLVRDRPVSRGDSVAAGQLLLTIDNRELIAKLAEARAAQADADANLANVLAGVREEEIAQRRSTVEATEANLKLAQQKYDRTKQLNAHDFASQQKLQQAAAALDVAGSTLAQAKSALSEAIAGATREQRGRPATALAGKFAPYLALFLVQFAVAIAILHMAFQLQFRGDALQLAASAILMIVSYLSLGALLQTLTKNLASGLSVTGIICSPAFGFAGVGFPVIGMSGFARVWGDLLPLRWYLQILFDQGAAPRLRFALAAPLGRALAHVTFSAPGFALYLIVLPRFYGFAATAAPLTLALLALPYMLAVSFLGQWLGVFVVRREAAAPLLIGVSLPMFFLVGVAWPQEEIPPLLRAAANLIPSSAGIEALLRANQMSASLADLKGPLATLWSLVALYGAARLEPIADDDDDLQPGMSVWLQRE